MSAIALILTEEYALFAGDGVGSDPDTGALSCFMSKIRLLPDLGAALAGTGIGGFDHLMQWFMPRNVVTFDDLVDALPGLVRHVHDHIAGLGLGDICPSDTNIVLAGWSPRNQRFEGWRVVTYPKKTLNADGVTEGVLEPWTLHPMPARGMWCSAAAPRATLERFGIFGENPGDDVDQLTRMICAARADSGIATDTGHRFNAGGYVQLAMIQRDQVQSWIAHRWPEDVIGKPVDPNLGDPMPRYLMDRDSETA